jgi:hypothetical protein
MVHHQPIITGGGTGLPNGLHVKRTGHIPPRRFSANHKLQPYFLQELKKNTHKSRPSRSHPRCKQGRNMHAVFRKAG